MKFIYVMLRTKIIIFDVRVFVYRFIRSIKDKMFVNAIRHPLMRYLFMITSIDVEHKSVQHINFMKL